MMTNVPFIFSVLLIICCFLCLYRIFRGPTSADRIVAVDILGILVVGFCALFAVYTPRKFFIGALALAKYLEGKGFDE